VNSLTVTTTSKKKTKTHTACVLTHTL